ncbi:restriction endonuclease subunit S [Rhodanobacter terrae]|uniref:Restriction endonuclease subunit S n=1 Tax=Rhodanobacter terrae TaxID=418647 RepID=A0ABW0T227_9GAMM
MLPKGWTYTTVADACETVSVGIVVNPSTYYVDAPKGVRAFRSGNVRENKVNDANWVFLSEEGSLKNKKSILRTGDVLVVRTGFAGTACVVPPEYDGANCIDILFARPRPKYLLPEYLSQLTNSESGRRQVFAGQTGLAQKHLNVSSYGKMKFGLPSVTEQRRVVHVLRTWDHAITVTERLLDNSRQQRRAFVSKVLTGKRRLERFRSKVRQISTPHGSIPGEWIYPRIESIAHEVSKKHSGGQNYPVLSCTKHAGLVDSLSYFKKQVFSKDLSTYKVVPKGCFVYATNHIEEGSIGYQDLYDFGLVSPMYTVFKTSAEVHDSYLYRLLKTEHFRQIFAAATNSSVDRRGSLRWNDFKKLHVPLPPMEEQLAIAELLDQADREIWLLEKKVASFRDEKNALMQQLLTGKRRVHLPEAAEAASP